MQSTAAGFTFPALPASKIAWISAPVNARSYIETSSMRPSNQRALLISVPICIGKLESTKGKA
jgi:hypothetical protein